MRLSASLGENDGDDEEKVKNEPNSGAARASSKAEEENEKRTQFWAAGGLKVVATHSGGDCYLRSVNLHGVAASNSLMARNT